MVTTLEEVRGYPLLADRLEGLCDVLVSRSDEAALWIGAGISAKYARLPTWSGFLNGLLSHIDLNNKDHSLIASLINGNRFSLAAECLADVLGNDLLTSLTATFASTRGIGLPDLLARATIRDIVTTNYDTMLETRLPWSRTLSPAQEIEALLSQEFKIVKLHGSIANPESCVLSLSSYVRAYNINMRWYLTSIFSGSSVIFLGCSMNPSEPCFQVLKLLRSTGRGRKRHFAVVAVTDNNDAKTMGKWLEQYGIELLPYIADAKHSFLDELFAELKAQLQSEAAIQHRLVLERAYVRDRRFFLALVQLWNVAHADMGKQNVGLRRTVGDAASEFFRATFELGTPGEIADLIEQTKKAKMDILHLWDRWCDLAIPSTKACFGLRRALEGIKDATGQELGFREQKLAELCVSSASEHARRR